MPIVKTLQTCTPPSLSTLPWLGVLPSASYHTLHTLPTKRLCRTHNHLPSSSTFPFPMQIDITSSPSLCILVALLVPVLPIRISTCNLPCIHRRMLATKAYPTTLFSWTLRVPALGGFHKCRFDVRPTTHFSTVPVTALHYSTRTPASLSLPASSRSSFR